MKAIKLALVSLAVLGMSQWDVCLASSSYHFEGPRQASASVAETPSIFSIEASLIPVTSFDKATNDQLNRAKLRGVVVLALVQHLNIPPTSEVTVSELRSTGLRNVSDRIIAEFEIPKSAILVVARASVVPVQSTASSMPVTAPIASALLTRKGDYLDTVRQLQEVQGAALAEVSRAEIKTELIAVVEQETANLFAELKKAVDGDLLLLSLEREEVFVAMATARQELAAQQANVQTIEGAAP